MHSFLLVQAEQLQADKQKGTHFVLVQNSFPKHLAWFPETSNAHSFLSIQEELNRCLIKLGRSQLETVIKTVCFCTDSQWNA